MSLWGLDKFTEVSIGRQLLNGLGHFAIGLGAGLVWSLLPWAVAAVPAWTIVVVGSLPELIREIVHAIKRGKPNLLDRLRDFLESVVGAAAAFGLAHLWI